MAQWTVVRQVGRHPTRSARETNELSAVFDPGPRPKRPKEAGSIDARQQALDLILGQHDRKLLFPLRSHEPFELPYFAAQDDPVEEENGAETTQIAGAKPAAALSGLGRLEGSVFLGLTPQASMRVPVVKLLGAFFSYPKFLFVVGLS